MTGPRSPGERHGWMGIWTQVAFPGPALWLLHQAVYLVMQFLQWQNKLQNPLFLLPKQCAKSIFWNKRCVIVQGFCSDFVFCKHLSGFHLFYDRLLVAHVAITLLRFMVLILLGPRVGWSSSSFLAQCLSTPCLVTNVASRSACCIPAARADSLTLWSKISS